MEDSSSSSSGSLVSDILVKDAIRRIPGCRRMIRKTGLCTKTQCTKSISCKLPPIHQPNRTDEEIWGVKSLPTDFDSVSKPSKIIEKLHKKRQAQHEETLNRIKNQQEEADLDIEAQIRLRAELFKRDLQNDENEIQARLKSLDLDQEEMLGLTKDNFNEIADVITEYHEKHRANLENFYIFLQNLEKERSSKYKIVLKSAYQDLHKISYILPYDIQQYFEETILRINQILLNNLRCYSDLQLQLNLQAENTNRIHMQTFDALKTKWKSIKKRDALIKFNERRLVQLDCEKIMLQTEQGKTITKMFSAKGQNMEQMWNSLTPLPISTKDVSQWSRSVQDTVDGLDFFARKLITMYKMAIVQVFNGYFDELQYLTEGMLEMGWAEQEELNAISVELCKPTIENVTRQYSSELFNLELLWDSVITQLQNNLQTTYLFLNAAAHLWDSHFQRVEEAKEIVLKDLKNVIQKNDKANQDQETKLNVALDTLRQASTEAKLENALDNVYAVFDNLKKTYNSHYTGEVKVVEKYDKIVMEEIEVLLAELEQFLHKYPKIGELATQLKKRASQVSANKEDDTPSIPMHMKLCEYQVNAVHNWMFGLREAIERYAGTCREEITQQANEWTSKQVKKLAKRLDVKLAIHISRYDRVKFDVYDIRLAELKTHFGRIERHKAGAEKEIADIRVCYADLEKQYKSIIDDYKKKNIAITSKMEQATTSKAIKAYISELKYSTTLCNQKLTDLMKNRESSYNTKLTVITQTATNFSKLLKLFLEEGSFNYEEAKKVTKDLKTFDKKIKKKFNAVIKEVAVKEKKLFAQVQQQEVESLAILKATFEEFEFNEKAIDMIRDVQLDIKNEAFNIKFLNKKFEQKFNDLEQNSMTDLGNLENFNHFEIDFSGTVLNLLEMASLLYQPEPVVNINTEGLIKGLSYSKQSMISYKSLLFNFQPMQNNSFMSKICSRLYNSFKALDTEAKKFYSTHKSDLSNSKIQPSYIAFMKEVLQKYFKYHLQCEILWLNLTNAFLVVLQRFFNYFKNFQNEFFQKYNKCQLEKLKKSHEELETSVSTIKKSNMQVLNQIHKQLKPLHGYNSNKHLLDALQNEMEAAMENIRNFDIDNLLELYKQNQDDHMVQYTSDSTEARTKFVALYSAAFPQLFCIPLLQQFEGKLSHMKTLSNTAYGEDVTDVMRDAYTRIEIPNNFEENLIEINELLQIHYQYPEGISCHDNMKLDNLVENFMEEYDQCMARVDNIKSTWHIETDTFEKIFNAEVQKVLKLYSVKYDNPDYPETQ